MEYQDNPQPDTPPSTSPSSSPKRPRRWWQQQRWLVPIALVILIVAVVGVAAVLTSGPGTDPEAVAADTEDASDPTATVSEGAAVAPTPPSSPEREGSAEDQQDQEVAQVCDRIIAFQEGVRSGRMDPLAAFEELQEIERQARGTRLSEQVNAANSVAQDVLTGQAAVDDVIDAGNSLAIAC